MKNYLESESRLISKDPSFDPDMAQGLADWVINTGSSHKNILNYRDQYVRGLITPKGFVHKLNVMALSKRSEFVKAESIEDRFSNASAYGAALLLAEYYSTGDFEF